ncbi:hypothetical protein Sste5346_009122 [Sporothrix stenoceras]|uniref:Ankyrin repeat protein n=1 Tax=Sporothrix stenoceras TaxID=5173 RepID=A0ABR3YMJ4_9PEZI
MTYERNGRYDPTVPIRPDDFPVLCASPYGKPDYGWDSIQHYQQELGVLRHAVDLDDVPAIREFLRLVGPEVLYWCDDGTAVNPTIIFATELGRVATLTALLDYRDSLSPAERDRMEQEYAYSESIDINWREWGTPLTTACMCAHVDVVRLFLARMPEVDINAPDKFGLNPLQTVARHAYTRGESQARIAIVRMLQAHGARAGPPDKGYELVGQTVREATNAWIDSPVEASEEDEWPKRQPLVDRPGGVGNALIQAVTGLQGADVALVRVLVDEAGIDVHKGYFAPTACFQGTGTDGPADDAEADADDEWRDDRELTELEKTERARKAHEVDVARFAAFQADPVATLARERAARDEKDRRMGPYQGPDTYLTPLAAAALFRNALGVQALLQIPGTVLATDLVAPSIPASFRTLRSGENETASIPAGTTAMRPLHAAMIGPEYRHLRTTRQRGPEYHQRSRNEDAHKDYLNDCLTTVQLLTTDPAVCAATVNATHPYVSPQSGQRYHYTPLHLGARFDRLPMLRILLDRGANPSIPVPHTGRSVFFSVFTSLLRLCTRNSRLVGSHYGAHFNGPFYRDRVRDIDGSIGTAGMTTIMRDLLRPGPKPRIETTKETTNDAARRLTLINEADADGNTALHWAMGFGLSHAGAALLALGARPGARNNAGEIPTEDTPPTTTRHVKGYREFE